MIHCLYTESPGQHKAETQCRRAPFTLIELLVAMAVLAILMLMVFQFFDGAQRAWTQTKANTRVYENARIALELIGRDLKTAVASSKTGEEIPFHIYDPDGGTDERIAFVAPLSELGDSELAEVTYQYTGAPDYVLERRIVSDTEGADWDFYGTTDGSWVGTAGSATFLDIVGGVEELTVTCHASDGTEPPGGSYGDHSTLPAYVEITLTLFDENLVDTRQELGASWETAFQNEIDKTRRTFTKIVFLN